MKIPNTPVWHYHHSSFLLEFPAESIDSRLAFIDKNKLPAERALRKKLLQPVRGELPAQLLQANQAWEQAWEAWEQAWEAWKQANQAWEQAWEAWEAWKQAWKAWNRAYVDNLPFIEALHSQECPDCPWDGTTIFTRKNDGGWY